MVNDISQTNGVQGPSSRRVRDSATTPLDKLPSKSPSEDNSQNSQSVNVSEAAKTLQKIEIDFNQYSDTDDEKVNAIAQEVASGSYKVNPEKLALKILAFDQQLPE
ncbi:MAG: flagellar biosynthesis anti-sigma factor FlgM [Pseudomonadota bacterium]